MGQYRYTLRAATRTISGMEIGRYGYAYKLGFDHYPGARNRRIAAFEAQAEDAAYKNRGLRHFIVGEFTEVAATPVPVFETEAIVPAFTEESRCQVIGHLIREGRSLRFISRDL